MSSSSLIPTYARLPVTFERGEGSWLYDTDGNKYLDALTGIAVCGLGHAHPAVTKTISEQASRLIHTSNIYRIGAQEALAERLTAISGMNACFFGNSGAEANEAAIKIARLYGHSKHIATPTIITMEGSFHGRTMATLSATGNPKVQEGFDPLVEGFVRVAFDDLDSVRQLAESNPNIVAVLVEPIQGEGGIHVPSDGYLAGLRDICDQHDLLLMLDEIQTGNGRTGKYFAFQHTDITPDVLTTAKGLGNGMPIGVCIVAGKAVDVLGPGQHGSTYGGNPLACATALTVVNTITSEHLPERAVALSERIVLGLTQRLAATNSLKVIRSKGLMIGIELTKPCGDLVKLALKKGLLINVTSNNVIRLLPALTLSNDDADLLVEKISLLISDWAK